MRKKQNPNSEKCLFDAAADFISKRVEFRHVCLLTVTVPFKAVPFIARDDVEVQMEDCLSGWCAIELSDDHTVRLQRF